MSEPANKGGSQIGSNASKMSERKRLEIQAELMDQKLQMETEKRKHEWELEKTRGELEKGKVQELQAESEIVELKHKRALERQQLRLQIEEAEGSIRASS